MALPSAVLIQLYSAVILILCYLISAVCSDTMSSDISDDLPVPEEMIEKLGDQRRKMLATLDHADDGTLDTSTMRERAGVPTGSINHHLELLERWGLIEECPDRAYTGQGGSRARIWQLTERGETFIDDHEDVLSPPQNAEAAEHVTALERRVEELEKETKQRRQTIVDILEVLTEAQDEETQEKVSQILADTDDST